MKKIISFCLWGNNPKYTIGAIRNAQLTNIVYPNWISRFYCGKSVPVDILNRLKNINNCEILIMEDFDDWRGMFWRFFPASEQDVEVMLSRDCDSRLNNREKSAVDMWMKSDKSFLSLRDHPYHNIPILGGMWGVKYPKLSNMKQMIDERVKGNYWQVDQNFLTEKIYPLVKDDMMVFDEFYGGLNFPLKRKGKEFVGEAFDHMDNPNQQHRNMIK